MCPWCLDPKSEEEDPEKLCLAHRAEFLGVTEIQLEKMGADWS
jgi:hypothetical protein